MSASFDTAPGQAVYSPSVLRAYDWWVLRVSCDRAWGCSSARLLEHYNVHVGARHMDVGVGSGYFLDSCRFPTQEPQVLLVDLNANSLAHTAHRIARYAPETLVHDVFKPIDVARPFDSIGINFLLHCLPGTMPDKAAALANLAAVLAPGGTLFGSTILGAGVSHNALGTALMALYNLRGIFSNRKDSEASLRAALEQSFAHVDIRVVGRVALFSALR